jgi:iron(III) transport system ATP-binding protein
MLECVALDVAYRQHRVVRALSLRLDDGRIGCLLGPSGCGKTTVLRAIAGLEPLRAGEIRLNGESVSRAGWTLAPERRGVGMVFQDFALFPHLDVAANLGFGLRRWSRADRAARVSRLLELVGLEGQRHSYPHQLSGGQQQRVALARALAPRPRLLLLDEPFSSLEVALREDIAREVRCILKEEGASAMLVTHDQHEAFAMADEIGVMHQGRLHQWAGAYDLYHRPTDRFVAGFIGQGVLLPGEVIAEGRVRTELGVIEGRTLANCPTGCAVEVQLRPDDLIDAPGDPDLIQGEVIERLFRGSDYLYTLRLPSGQPVLCLTLSHHVYEVGQSVPLRVAAEHLVAFPRS